MCVNFNCILFRKSMQLDLNKNNKKLLLFQEHFQTEWLRLPILIQCPLTSFFVPLGLKYEPFYRSG